MKEELNDVGLDIRKHEIPIDPVDLMKSITSNNNADHDPFYIVDLEEICNKHINWITRLPRVEPHYAIKCNTNEMMLKLLAYLGAGFDCASRKEIQTILDLGVSPDRIIYANPCKQTSYIKYAYKQGVDLMTFDNESELYKIKDNHPNAKLVLRIITNDTNAVCKFSMKFGADMETSYKLIDLALKLNLNLVGISFHVGSGQMTSSAFADSIKNAKKLFDYAERVHGLFMDLLDIGGGFPGAPEHSELFNQIAGDINQALDTYFPESVYRKELTGDDEYEGEDGLKRRKLRVIAEPGRYYSCAAFTLCVNVIAKRVMIDPQTNERQIMYYINDGVYSSFNCIFYDHITQFQPIVLNRDLDGAPLVKSSIWGPTCDGLDCVLKEIYMSEIDIGTFIAFRNMGAYTIAGAVEFNGLPLARPIYSVSTSWNTIKNAFTDSESNTNGCENTLADQHFAFNNQCFKLSGSRHHHSQQQLQSLTVGAGDENCVILC